MSETGGPFSELPDLVSGETARRYERWVLEQPSDEAYLFTDARVRFDARDADVLVAASGVTVRSSPDGVTLASASLPSALEIRDVPARDVERFFAAIDGEKTLGKVVHSAEIARDAVRALLAVAFGRVVFAPLAVLLLERAVPSTEIVRFPGSPYEVPRNYWQNMASVRKLVPRLVERSKTPSLALEDLRRLHAIALVGEDETSFYRPASPIAKKGVAPSRLWLAPAVTTRTAEGIRFEAGPRVGARWLGGERYGELLAERAGDPGAVAESLEHRDAVGLDWGRVVVARAEGDPEPAPWFCPPRPLTDAHVASLFGSLEQGDLAGFHQKFIRLHPFRAANQSVAMSVVNAVLARSAPGGIPHLVLDHLALRLAPEAYRRVFALALSEWATTGGPAERMRAYAERKHRYYGFVQRLANAPGPDEARALALASPNDARLALLLPET